MTNPLVSICCTTYNHERYITRALEGFMQQKTSFPFEVLIHDDASTDGTSDIIKKYQEKYPDIIKPIYQIENKFSQGIKPMIEYNYSRAMGKYIALCEGDDYWTDPYKLEKQVEFMEMHPEYVVCYHDAEIRDADENLIAPTQLQERLKTELTEEQLQLGVWLLTLTVLFRNLPIFKNYPIEHRRILNNDIFLTTLLGAAGKGMYLGNSIKPAVYHQHSNGIWSSLDIQKRNIHNWNTQLNICIYKLRAIGPEHAAHYLFKRIVPLVSKLYPDFTTNMNIGELQGASKSNDSIQKGNNVRLNSKSLNGLYDNLPDGVVKSISKRNGIVKNTAMLAKLLRCKQSNKKYLYRIYFLSKPCNTKNKNQHFKYLGYNQFENMFNEIFIKGCYSIKFDHVAPLIFDCGSNIGLSVLYFKSKYPNAKIVSFEPDPLTFDCLKENIDNAKLKNVVCHNTALANRSGTIQFYTDKNIPGLLRMSTNRDRLLDCDIIEKQVNATQLSTYIDDTIDLLKMDIEGSEYEVLLDLVNSGKILKIKNLIIEYHHNMKSSQCTLSTFLDILEVNGFVYNLRAYRCNKDTTNAFQDILIYAKNIN